MDISATDLTMTGANTKIEGTAKVDIESGGNVKITGALIYLN